MIKIPSEYAGKCIATVNDKVVAVCDNSLEAYQKAKKGYPNQLISLMCVPRKEDMITFL